MVKDILDLWIDDNGTVALLKSSSFDVYPRGQSKSTYQIFLKQYHSSPCNAILGFRLDHSNNRKYYQHDVDFPSIIVASNDSISSWAIIQNNGNEAKYCPQSLLKLNQVIEKEMGRTKKSLIHSSSRLNVSSSKSALCYTVANVVYIIAVSSNNLGLASYKCIKHESIVIDSKLITLVDDGEPIVLITTNEKGEMLVWDIRTERCIRKISLSKEHCALSYESQLTIQTYRPEEESAVYGYIGYICNYELSVTEFALFIDEENCSTNFTVEDPIEVYHQKEFAPIALSFIQAQNRICVLVTTRDICLVDCLQKHVVKKISVHDHIANKIISAAATTTSDTFMKVAINFPFVGILSDNLEPLIRHKLDSVFALVGAMTNGKMTKNDGKKKERHQCVQYHSLIMDEAAKKRWTECFNAKQKSEDRTCLVHKDVGNRAFNTKSSGYGMIGPKMKLGSAPSFLKEAQNQKRLKIKEANKRREKLKAKTIYPITCNLIDCHQEQHDDNGKTCSLLPPVSTLNFSPNGEYLATTHKNSVVHVLKLPFSKYKPASYQIADTHPCSIEDEKVQSSCRASWSSHGNEFLAHHNKIYCLSPKVKSMSIACDLDKDTSNATFFSQDKCILCTKVNQISLFQISFNRCMKSNKISIQPLHECCSSGECNSSTLTFKSQRIKSIASVNGSMTNLIACSCSDKTLQIIDVVQNKILWSKQECAGSRPAHSIAFPQPSQHCPIASENYNLLVTASTDNGGLLSLFDLRCGDIVKRFHGHVNRKDLCMTSFSPCVRYIAIGGEGLCGSPTLYDLRGKESPMKTNLGYNQQGNPFRDGSITDCQFNPIYPQVVTGSLSGQLRWYTEY